MWDAWLRRRQQVGRQLAEHCGLWSEIWRQRNLDWEDHVVRSREYDSPLFAVHEWHDANRLISHRLQFVPSNGLESTRNRPDAGRLGP